MITANDTPTENDDLALQLYRALRLTTCWCTEPKYWKNEPPRQCARCAAIERFEQERAADAARFTA